MHAVVMDHNGGNISFIMSQHQGQHVLWGISCYALFGVGVSVCVFVCVCVCLCGRRQCSLLTASLPLVRAIKNLEQLWGKEEAGRFALLLCTSRSVTLSPVPDWNIELALPFSFLPLSPFSDSRENPIICSSVAFLEMKENLQSVF